MQKQNSIGGYFFPEDSDTLVFKSVNNLRHLCFQMFFVAEPIMLFWHFLYVLRDGEEPVWRLLHSGRNLDTAAIILFPFLLLILGLLLPKVHVQLDRLQGVVRHQLGRRVYVFPWSQVTFTHQWVPTKTGGSTLFALRAIPPFPEALQRKVEKRLRNLDSGNTLAYNLGSFDVKSPEEGQAVYAFLDAWMHSREPADALYRTMVADRFGE